MTRLLLAALAAAVALVALLWANARDLRQPWTVIPTPDPDDDMAGVQVDVRPMVVGGTWYPFLDGVLGGEPSTYNSSDEWPRPWAYSTQTGPLGPAA